MTTRRVVLVASIQWHLYPTMLWLYPQDLYVVRRHFLGQTVPKDSFTLSKIHISLVGSPSSTPQLTFITNPMLHISIHPKRPHPRAFIRLSTTTPHTSLRLLQRMNWMWRRELSFIHVILNKCGVGNVIAKSSLTPPHTGWLSHDRASAHVPLSLSGCEAGRRRYPQKPFYYCPLPQFSIHFIIIIIHPVTPPHIPSRPPTVL